MGQSTVLNSVRDDPRAIREQFHDVLRLPATESELEPIVRGFQQIAGLPYCVGAIYGSHVLWARCPTSQHYEYRSYKGFERLIPFAVSTADHQIIYADISQPAVRGDSTIFRRSKLLHLFLPRSWLGPEVPWLLIGLIAARLYLMGDRACRLPKCLMKTYSKGEIKANSYLYKPEKRAFATRKPTEFAFGIIKNSFTTVFKSCCSVMLAFLFSITLSGA